jgi:hypothetical protein
MRLAVISISLVGLGSLVGYTLAVRSGPHAAPAHRENTATQETQVARSAGPGQELGTRVISVESELSALRARLEQLEAAPAPSSSPVPQTVPKASAPEELARQEEEWRAHIAEVETKYQLEGRDPAWAHETQAVITRALDALPVLSKGLRSLDCRSETCRLEVINDHQPDFDKQLPLLPLGLRGLPAAEYDQAPEPDGKVRTTVYFKRHANEPSAG